jgi:hypothetical protein
VSRREEMRMPSKPKRKGTAEPHAISSQSVTREISVCYSARDGAIKRRESEICLERGGQLGREPDDWLQAELELEREMLLSPKRGSAAADIDRRSMRK